MRIINVESVKKNDWLNDILINDAGHMVNYDK
jgi:hypothetical protein